MSVIRKYISQFPGMQSQMLRDLDASLDYLATRAGGGSLRPADSPAQARQVVASPTAAAFGVSGGSGKFVVVINPPQSVDAKTVALARAAIQKGINTAQTQILYQLQTAIASSFDNAAQVIDYGASPQIRYEITSPEQTRYFRLRSSFDGQTWNAWQIFPGQVSSGVLPGGGSGGTGSGGTGGTPPATLAGGDLSGTYPNPSVVKIHGDTPAAVATSGSYNDLSDRPSIPDAFTDLSDTPSAYAGAASKTVTVKADASGLEFTTPPVGVTLPIAESDVTGLVGDLSNRLNMTATQAANKLLSGPASGANVAPTFRSMVHADMPLLEAGSSLVGKPDAGAVVAQLAHIYGFTFAANFAGSTGSLEVNPASTAVYTIKKNGSTVGTVSISTSGVFTFATSGGTTVAFAANDRLTIEAPSPQDSTLSDVIILLAATRN